MPSTLFGSGFRYSGFVGQVVIIARFALALEAKRDEP